MPSENSVMANFGEFPFRDCPKRVGGACGVTLRSTSTVLFDPFWPPCASQIHAHSVAQTPFRTVSPRTPVNKSGQASSEALSDYTRGCSRCLRLLRLLLLAMLAREVLGTVQNDQHDRHHAPQP